MLAAAPALLPDAVVRSVPAPPTATAKPCEQDYPALTGRVVDEADLVDAAFEERLTNRLATLESETQHQMVVVTVASLQDKPIADYATCLGNHWGVGREEADDGVLLLVAPNQRMARIAVGLGLEEALTDAEAKTIMDTQLVPAFRDAEWARGIEDGVTAIIAEVK